MNQFRENVADRVQTGTLNGVVRNATGSNTSNHIRSASQHGDDR